MKITTRKSSLRPRMRRIGFWSCQKVNRVRERGVRLSKFVKGFVNVLVLASGYQSSGLPASWDVLSMKRALQWSLYFEKVTSPSGDIVHVKGTSGEKFQFKAPRNDMYKFCFHNPYSTPETVSFYIHVSHIPNEHDLAKDEHLDPINVKIAESRESQESVAAEQKYLKARDTKAHASP